MRRLPVLLAALLGLAACAGEPPAAPRAAPDRSDAPAPPPDTPATRAAAAGLDREQAAALAALGVAVYVPAMPAGWTLTSATADSLADGAAVWPEYTLRYLTDRRTCLAVVAASEGLGDVFAEEPPRERDIRVAGVPTAGPARLGWGVAGERTAGWEDGRVATEWFGTDVLAVRVEAGSTDGCPPASPEAAEAVLTSLRPLNPADDAAQVGAVVPVETFRAVPPGPDPESVARAAFGPAEGGSRLGTTVETLARQARAAVVLVTTVGQSDDSVRDARTRAVLVRGPGGWSVRSAGRQVRCQPGRGHADWSAEFCV